MKTKDVIQYFGSIENAAKKLGFKMRVIRNWGETVPEDVQHYIEHKTDNEVKAK